ARCQGSGIAGPAESMPKRILVVEDDPDHRRIVTKVLTREGYDVIEAATGVAAVAAAREDRPDLIIMDLALPGLDGFEASRRIKAAPDSADIPIVALTAFAMRGDEERARAAVEQQRPDLVLLDVMMPQMSGMEVLDRLRANPATAGVPVILVTAKDQDEDLLAGYKYGADYYITKPFSAKQLLYGIGLV